MTECQGALYAVLAIDLIVVLIVAAATFALGWFIGTTGTLRKHAIMPNDGRDHVRQRERAEFPRDERRT